MVLTSVFMSSVKEYSFVLWALGRDRKTSLVTCHKSVCPLERLPDNGQVSQYINIIL